MLFYILGLVFRWMHILAAITAVGGTIFMRMALQPSMAVMSEEQRHALQNSVRTRWVRPLMLALAFLLVSGLYNIGTYEMKYDLAAIPYYRPLFIVKFILALVIMYIASALVGSSKATERMRANAKFWLNLNMWLAIILVMISGVLRMADKPLKEKPAESDTTSAPAAIHSQFLPGDVRPIMLQRAS